MAVEIVSGTVTAPEEERRFPKSLVFSGAFPEQGADGCDTCSSSDADEGGWRTRYAHRIAVDGESDGSVGFECCNVAGTETITDFLEHCFVFDNGDEELDCYVVLPRRVVFEHATGADAEFAGSNYREDGRCELPGEFDARKIV